MRRCVVLDAGVIGLLCTSGSSPGAADCAAWLRYMVAAEARVYLPAVAVYEVRRELIRLDARAKLARLDELERGLGWAHGNGHSWRLAAEFWAHVRKAGKPTADPHALDADAILAAVAVGLARPAEPSVIATTNVRHLARFPGVVAQRWEEIR